MALALEPRPSPSKWQLLTQLYDLLQRIILGVVDLRTMAYRLLRDPRNLHDGPRRRQRRPLPAFVTQDNQPP